jgi:hypothetical protein
MTRHIRRNGRYLQVAVDDVIGDRASLQKTSDSPGPGSTVQGNVKSSTKFYSKSTGYEGREETGDGAADAIAVQILT